MSKSNNRNPYHRGNYQLGFAWMQKNQVFARSELVAYLMTLKDRKGKNLGENAAMATATVLLSPRKVDSKRGDCRGNYSAEGHMYYVEPLRKEKGDEKRFRLFYRKDALTPRPRPDAKDGNKKHKKTVKKAVKKVVETAPAVAAPAAPAAVETPAPAAVETPAVVETAPAAVETPANG